MDKISKTTNKSIIVKEKEKLNINKETIIN